MEEFLTQAVSSGDIKMVVIASILYLIIYFQRSNTKKSRDEAQDSIETRLTLLEADNKILHQQLDSIGSKLDKIIVKLKLSLQRKKIKNNGNRNRNTNW